MRLPSFSYEHDTPYTWKKGVMDSLQIQSPSVSNLVPTPIRRRSAARSKRESSFINWPLRETVLTPDSEVGLLQKSPQLGPSASEAGSLLVASARPSEDIGNLAVPKPSFDHGLAASRYGSCSSSGGGRPHFFGRPERRPPRGSSHSVHLYSMNISRHLRSTSMTSSSGLMSKPGTRAPTAAPTRSQTPVPPSREVSRTHSAVEDLPPLPPSATKTRASSEYSHDDASRPSSPVATPQGFDGAVSTPAVEKGVNDMFKPTTPATTTSRCSSLQTPKATQNQSTSNLSETSKNSSKVSRFKEDFGTPDKNKNKRRSIVNMFNQLALNAKTNLRKRNESIDSFDGTFNEPRRLQRAIALTDQRDAAGLLAKAIRDKQAEKAALYLKPNKELAQREVFRQRSSSFCRPRGDSLAAEQAAGGPSGIDWHRRSTSDTFLKPDASMPNLQPPAPAAVPRAHSTGHLTPEFTTPVFSGSTFLTPQGGRSPGRTLSISIDPTAISPSRRGSFAPTTPTVPETPELSLVAAGKRISVSAPGAGERPFTSDSNDANLGAWSRYPSHTREERTGSAGARDDVKTRDFAYDINPLNIAAESSDNDITDGKSKKRGKKQKRRTGKLPKSRSMMFGGLKNYAKMFTRSSSAEFISSGKGHRSSISAGGALKHPELELLPPVFAPMPSIPDRHGEEDPGLEPGRDEIELKKLRHRRGDHGHSFAEPPHHPPSRAGPPRVDGASEYAAPASPEQTRRIASSPALVGTLKAPDGTIINNALHYARHYESCVHLPPSTSHSTVSRSNFTPLNQTSSSDDHHRIDIRNIATSMPHSPTVWNLVDKMLASPPTSTNVSPLPSPLLEPIQTIAEVTNPLSISSSSTAFVVPTTSHRIFAHAKSKSVTSVRSNLRASSMDLLLTLKEAEERERQRALEDLLTRADETVSAGRGRRSTDVSRSAEMARPMVEEYEVEGVLGGGHHTWPAVRRGAGGVEV